MGVASDVSKMHNVTSSFFCPLFWQDCILVTWMPISWLMDKHPSPLWTDKKEYWRKDDVGEQNDFRIDAKRVKHSILTHWREICFERA